MSNIRDPFVEFGAGKTVFREGETGAEMYIIESGQVELQSKARAARPALVYGPGDFFGADFLLDGKARTSTATVKENARLLRLTRAGLAEVVAQNPEIALGLLRRQLEQQAERERQEQTLSSRPASRAPEPVAEQPSAEPAKAAPAPVPPPVPAAASPPPPQPAMAPAPAAAAPPAFALRHIATGELLRLDAARADFLVGRPDPAAGSQPEIDLGPYDQNRNLSRRHARIVQRSGVYCVLEETATTNGTYVNGDRLQTGVEVPLKPGDKLRFGSIEVEFVSL